MDNNRCTSGKTVLKVTGKAGALLQVSNPSAREVEEDRPTELTGQLAGFYSTCHLVCLVSHFPDEKLRYERV